MRCPRRRTNARSPNGRSSSRSTCASGGSSPPPHGGGRAARATENALCIDGRLTKIGEELDWQYSWDEPLRPWRVRGAGVDVTLTPEHDRYDDTDLKIVKMEVHQCFGTWSGTVRGEDGTTLAIDGIDGFAEEARNRW